MKSHKLIVTLVAGVIGWVMVGCTSEPKGAGTEKSTVKRTVLIKKQIADVADRSGQVVMVEIEPGGATGRHTHPVDELMYILEGAGSLERPDHSAVRVGAGETMAMPIGQAHEMKNTSSSAPLKFLQFSVVAEGQPMTTPAK